MTWIKVHTVARKVELFMDPGKLIVKKLSSFTPAIMISPNTEIEILTVGSVSADHTPYFYCYYGEKKGFISRHSIKRAYVRTLSGVKGGLTGIKYGAYARTTAAAAGGESDTETIYQLDDQVASKRTGRMEATVDKEILLKWASDKTCEYCAKERGEHKLLESSKIRQIAIDAATYVRGQAGTSMNCMMGAIEIRDRRNQEHRSVALACSDAGCNKAGFKTALKAYADNNKYIFVDPIDFDHFDDVSNFKGETLDYSDLGETENIVTGCAGPKLVQWAISKRKKAKFEHDIFMSEIWYSNTNKHDEYTDFKVADSCDRCRLVISRMMCGWKNRFKKSSVGRPKDWMSFTRLEKQ